MSFGDAQRAYILFYFFFSFDKCATKISSAIEDVHQSNSHAPHQAQPVQPYPYQRPATSASYYDDRDEPRGVYRGMLELSEYKGSAVLVPSIVMTLPCF